MTAKEAVHLSRLFFDYNGQLSQAWRLFMMVRKSVRALARHDSEHEKAAYAFEA
jgi:hypothetical protein